MSDSSAPAPQASSVSRDIAEIDDYDRWARDWCERSKMIVQRYRDERAISSYSEAAQGRRFNILWSNVETLKPALLARPPKPVVERRFRDNDPAARAAADVLERATTYATDGDAFFGVLLQCRDDRLLPGRGQAWVRYEAEVEEPEEAAESYGDDDDAPTAVDHPPETPNAVLKSEKIEFDYVDWRDFGHTVARTWVEVPRVWRRIQMTRQQLVDRFGEIGATVPLDAKPAINDGDNGTQLRLEMYSRAWVYEIWDKDTRTVRWVNRSTPQVLDERPDPYGLKEFFPCPRPLYATLTTDTLIPVPDFALYQDQARELDDLNARLAKMVEACKVIGVYDATQDSAMARMLTSGKENELLPMNNWAAFLTQGGMQGAMQFLPLEPIVKAIAELTNRMQAVKQEVYEITGIADIIRGASAASETATAQEIKGRFAGLRLSDMQGEMARFSRDLIAIAAELIAEHFAQETIFEMAQIKLPTQAEVQAMAMQAAMMGAPMPPVPPVTQEAVMEILRNDMQRCYRVEIETDSTIALDEQAEKERANEFVSAFAEYQTATLPLIQAAPEMLPVFKEMALYSARRYRAGRQLEGAIEQAYDAMQERAQAMQNQPPPPDPVMMKAEADVQRIQARTAADVQRTQVLTQADIMAKQQRLEADVAMEAMRPVPMQGPEVMQ